MANILIIGPHPDDQELGMGGTIAKLADQGHDVLLLDMTDGSPTPHGDRDTRLPESLAAAAALAPHVGAGRVRRVLLDLPNRTVVHSVEARHRVAGVIRAHQATILFVPHPVDAHPDHLATTRIAEDARFDAKLTRIEMPTPPGFPGIGPPIHPKWLFYYYCTHLRTVPQPSFLIDTTGYEARKRESILAYRTQFVDHPGNRAVPDWIAAQDRFMGSRIGTASAEPFWAREPLGLTNLSALS
ncbi:MAG: PIG-L family deacetylase [Planctomycetes bacterium]|nr:PIG-L family deacetylase [Planctomycetota bacterium]